MWKQLKIFNHKSILKICFTSQWQVHKLIRTSCQESILDFIDILLMQKIANVFWWHTKKKFLIIAILVQYYIGILVSWIKIECNLFIVGILIALHRCHVQTNNMDKLILVNKKWLFNPQFGYLKPIDFAFACEVEFDHLVA
jgi:hypothetical protein